jgi:hypothetical protein
MAKQFTRDDWRPSRKRATTPRVRDWGGAQTINANLLAHAAKPGMFAPGAPRCRHCGRVAMASLGLPVCRQHGGARWASVRRPYVGRWQDKTGSPAP